MIVAMAGRTAGNIGQTRKDWANNIIPGAAIATALMPPICTCGYAIANGDIVKFSPAMYLFLQNAYFIHLSAGLVLSLLRIPRAREMSEAEWGKARKRMIRNTLIIVVPSVILLIRAMASGKRP